MKVSPKEQPVKKPTPSQIRGAKLHDICNKKVNSLVLQYFDKSKDNEPSKHYYFSKLNSEWKLFAAIKNKQQRDVVVNDNTFEKRIVLMMDLAEKQIAEQNQIELNSNENK